MGIRPEKRKPLNIVEIVTVLENGLKGDHYAGRSGNRSVTLIQQEHIAVIASLLHRDIINPVELRRNIVVSGINLLALKDREFKIGTAILKMTGLCQPCSRMEEVFGEGGYNAVRGHGGINACVVLPGIIRLRDKVEVLFRCDRSYLKPGRSAW
ncbi:MAG: MOSC domain-containing protein [Gammaproteobacteria bacterium]|nr:MOSC domain-containing protein [Gammaproteobacteria bacterium]